VDVQRELELAAGQPRKRGEAPKLVDTQPVGVTLELDRPVRATPARDARRPPAAGDRQLRPGAEGDRLRARDPVDAAVRHGAVRGTDALADRDVRVVAGEHIGQAERPPHLAEARVGVEEHAARRRGQQLFVGHVTHHVEQQVGAAQERERVRAGDARVNAVADVDRIRAVQSGVAKCPPHPLDAGRVPALEPIEQQNLVAQGAEAEQVLHELPRVPGGTGLARDGAADRDPPSCVHTPSRAKIAQRPSS
jgi:hypothetical protein